MPIQIIIDGNHATDILSELETLTAALRGKKQEEIKSPSFERAVEIANGNVYPECKKYTPGDDPWMANTLQQIKDEETKREVEETQKQESEVDEAPKKLSRGQHRIEADKMIANGEIDEDIYPLLSKMQQERVQDALAVENENLTDAEIEAAISQPAEPEDVAGLFDDEPEEIVKGVTLDDVRALIVKTCRDKDGKDIPQKYAAAREEMRKVIPEGQDVKLSNIPVSALQILYDAISKI